MKATNPEAATAAPDDPFVSFCKRVRELADLLERVEAVKRRPKLERAWAEALVV